MVGVPAVVVGDHGDGSVAEFGLAGELGLGHVRHADHVAAPDLAVHPRLGQRAELRPLHREVGAAAVDGHALRLAGLGAGGPQARAGRMRDRDVRNAALTEERLLAREGAVDELVHDDEMPRRHRLAERAAGADRDQFGHAEAFQGVDVGAVGDGGRRMDVPPAVAGQESHRHAVQGAGQDRVGRLTPRRLDRAPFRAHEGVQLIDPRAADHADHRIRFRHAESSRLPRPDARGPRARRRERERVRTECDRRGAADASER